MIWLVLYAVLVGIAIAALAYGALTRRGKLGRVAGWMLGRAVDKPEEAVAPVDEQSLPDFHKRVLRWQQVLIHAQLKELIRVDGMDRHGRPFWVILEPARDHYVHVLAYELAGTMGRAPVGAPGIASLRSSQWVEIAAETVAERQVRVVTELRLGEPLLTPGTEVSVCVGNVLDYIEGNAVVIKAIASDVSWQYIKDWDMPAEFAFSAYQADLARVTHLASAVTPASAAVTAATTGSGVIAASWTPEAQRVYVLKRGWGDALRCGVGRSLAVRVFDTGSSRRSEEEIAQQIRSEGRMHMRIRPSVRPAPGEGSHLWAVYQDEASSEVKAEGLRDRNVVGFIRTEEGGMLDVIRICEVEEGGGISVRIENLGEQQGMAIAVWEVE